MPGVYLYTSQMQLILCSPTCNACTTSVLWNNREEAEQLCLKVQLTCGDWSVSVTQWYPDLFFPYTTMVSLLSCEVRCPSGMWILHCSLVKFTVYLKLLNAKTLIVGNQASTQLSVSKRANLNNLLFCFFFVCSFEMWVFENVVSTPIKKSKTYVPYVICESCVVQCHMSFDFKIFLQKKLSICGNNQPLRNRKESAETI